MKTLPRPLRRPRPGAASGVGLAAASALLLTFPAMSPQPLSAAEGGALQLNLRHRSATEDAEVKPGRWDPEKTALIICDMWDDHWCKSAAARVGELAVPLDAVAGALRERGVLVIHAPSSVVSFYDGTPQRERARKAAEARPAAPLSTDRRWGTAWCWPDPERERDLPIDDTDMGCDCAQKCALREAWTRQIETLRLHPQDALTDDGQETINLLTERGIENVILSGVHLNMCVLGRPFGIRQMVYQGKNVALLRDLTDTMYDPRMRPHVSHFEGTDRVVEHIERHWCPSFTSADITGGEPFRFKGDKRATGKE